MVKFWMKMIIGSDKKLSYKMYNVCRLLDEYLPWLSKIKEILYSCGLYAIWDYNIPVNPQWLSKTVKLKLKDIYLSEWRQSVDLSSKCYLYRIYKNDIKLEDYLVTLPSSLRINLCKFRTVNHNLPVETGRYRNIPRHLRYCTICNKNVLCDEFHIIFVCKELQSYRRKYLPDSLCSHGNISVLRLHDIINCSGNKLVNLALFAKYCLGKFT